MYLNDEINEEILKEKPYSTRNDLSYSVLNSSYKSKNKSLEQKSSFKAAVPCGKLFGRQNLLIEKSDQELQEDLVKIKTQKLKGNSHSPIRKNLEASWKPGNYYPRLFNEEKLLVHDTSPKKFQPHDQYANYIEEIKQINHAVNLEKISDYDEPGYNKLTEEQKKQVKERLYRYDHLEDKSFQKYLEDIKTRTKLPQIEKKNGSLSPRVVKEKGWRPQRTIPITFTENTNRIKKVKNNIMNDQQHNNSTSTQTNSINTSAIGINNHQQQSSEIVKKVKYPKIIDSKEGGKELLKLAKSNNGNRASSPSNNQKKFYQPHFKDLHNYNNQDQFTNKVLNHYN